MYVLFYFPSSWTVWLTFWIDCTVAFTINLRNSWEYQSLVCLVIFFSPWTSKKQISTKEASLQSMQILVQNLTRKVGDSEERCSLLQEQIASLKSFQNKEKEHFQEREAMYTQNVSRSSVQNNVFALRWDGGGAANKFNNKFTKYTI